MGVKTVRAMAILTPTLRPRRAEQDSVGLPMDVTPQRDARRRRSACYCAPSRSHPVNGSLLHAPAPLPHQGIGIYTSRLSRAHSSLRNRIVGRKSVAPSAVCKGGRQFTSARVSPQSRSQWMERGGISVESSYGERLDLTTLEHSCGGRRYAFPPYSNEDV